MKIKNDLLDSKEISLTDIYYNNRNELYMRIENRIEQTISAMNTSELLSLILIKENITMKIVKPVPSLKYTKILVAFLKKKTIDGYIVDSLLSPKITKIIEDEITEFYSEENRINDLLYIITTHINEIQSKINSTLTSSPGTFVQNSLVKELGKKLGVKISKEILINISKTISATSTKGTIYVVGKSIITTPLISFIKPIIMKILANISLAMIVKTAIGKALFALLGLASITASVPVMYILIPIIGVFMIHEYKNFPSKLSVRLKKDIIKSLEENFETMNEEIVGELTNKILQDI